VLSCGAGLKVGIMPNGFSFDVGSVLGSLLRMPPLPEAKEGDIVLRVSEGICLIGLRDSDVGEELMYHEDW
jgi:hypothetical protein